MRPVWLLQRHRERCLDKAERIAARWVDAGYRYMHGDAHYAEMLELERRISWAVDGSLGKVPLWS